MKRIAHGVGVVWLAAFASLPAVARELDGVTPPSSKYDWRALDRHNYLKARASTLMPTFGMSQPGSEFFNAWRENVLAKRPGEYSTIAQRHAFYDVFAHYLTSSSTDAPEALRCVRFFHAAAAVTNEFGLGTVEVKRIEQVFAEAVGAIPAITPTSADVLKSTNEALFARNFEVIRSLLVDWKQPRSPLVGSPTQAIPAIQFDLEMVRLEQALVEERLEKFKRAAKPEEVAALQAFVSGHPALDRSVAFAYYGLAGLSAVEVARRANLTSTWLPPILGARWNFLDESHRVALGQAMVFRAHGLTKEDYATFKRTGAIPSSKCTAVALPRTPPKSAAEARATRAALVSAALSRDRSGLSFAFASTGADLVTTYSSDKREMARRLERLTALAKRRTAPNSTRELLELLNSPEAQELGLSRHSGPVISSVSGKQQSSFERQLARADVQERRIAAALEDDSGDLLGSLLRELTGLQRNATPTEVQWSSASADSREIEQIQRAIEILRLPKEQQEAKLREALLERLEFARQSALAELELAQKYLAEGWSKSAKADEAWQNIRELAATGNVDAGLSALDAVAAVTGDKRVAELAGSVRNAIDLYRSGATMLAIVSMGGFAGVGSIGAVEGALGSLGSGSFGGSDAEIKATLKQMFEFLRAEFANVNLKLDQIIELVKDQQKTLAEIQVSIASLSRSAARIEARLDELQADLQATGFNLVDVVTQLKISDCRGVASSAAAMTKIGIVDYTKCVRSIVTFLELSYSPLVAKCPTGGSGLSDLASKVLVESDAVAASRFACEVAREVSTRQGRTKEDETPALDVMAPWPWLADGTLLLEKFQLQRPDLWAQIGADTQQALLKLHQRLARSTEMIGSVAGETGALRQRYLQAVYATSFAPELRKVSETLEDEQRKRTDAAFALYLNQLIEYEKTKTSKGTEFFPAIHEGLFRYRTPPCSFDNPDAPAINVQMDTELAPTAALRRLKDGWWPSGAIAVNSDPYTPLLCIDHLSFKYQYSPARSSVSISSTVRIVLRGATKDAILSDQFEVKKKDFASIKLARCERFGDFTKAHTSCLFSIFEGEFARDQYAAAISKFIGRSDVQSAVRDELEEEVRARRGRDKEFVRRYDLFLLASAGQIISDRRSKDSQETYEASLKRYEAAYALMKGYLMLLLPHAWSESDRLRDLFATQADRSWTTSREFAAWFEGTRPLSVCGIRILPVQPTVTGSATMLDHCEQVWDRATSSAVPLLNDDANTHPSLMSVLGLSKAFAR